ncbi:MAG: hypothetical protein GY797_19040 [Deltaproteobacteria bacterium]|nr:hypothetical protein [Deltaproteobacteria bacterium]
MENIKHCAVIVRRPEDVWEGTRTTLGLAAHNYWAYLFVVDVTIEMYPELEENLEWLEEMECPFISNIEENSQHGFQYLSLEKLARELKKMDLVIPFGNRN